VDEGGDSYSGRTPLMQAASSGNIQLVQVGGISQSHQEQTFMVMPQSNFVLTSWFLPPQLLLDAGADPDAVDRFGRYASMDRPCFISYAHFMRVPREWAGCTCSVPCPTLLCIMHSVYFCVFSQRARVRRIL
jgi:hypothetical protein